MNRRIYFKGMESSPIIEDQVTKELARIEEFLANDRTPQSIEVVLEYHPTHAHSKCEIRIKSPSYDVIISKEGQDLAKLVEIVLHLAYEELHRQKRKWTDKDKEGCVQDCTDLLKRQLKIDEEE